MTSASTKRFSLVHVTGFAMLSVVTLLGFAAPLLPSDWLEQLGPALGEASHAPWAPAATILGYTVLASLGVPQIVLITAIVAVFGPWLGLGYAWNGKMLACAFGFAVGRRFGAQIVAQHSGPRLALFMSRLARRGLLVSALIRLAPTVPSVLINIAAGATPIRFRDFIIGTAIGSVPKMALMAFGGAAAMEAMHDQSLWAWLAIAAVVFVWIVLALLARRWLSQVKPEANL